MNAVGIDVSKGKSMVAVMRPLGEVALSPREFPHTVQGLKQLAALILSLDDETRVVMEATGRYHEPIAAALLDAGLFVCVLNPIVVHQSGAGSIRKVKNDSKDALKIAKYGIDNWALLRPHTQIDTLRQQLKLFTRQYDLCMKTVVSLQNNLISLLDKSFPGANEFFSSPLRDDGHQKWVDFIATFWHCQCVCGTSLVAFTERYRKWCKRHDYNFSVSKAETIYAVSKDQFTTLPKSLETKCLITVATNQLIAVSKSLAELRAAAIRLAAKLPEYKTVLALFGVGQITATHLIAEIGDVTRFPNRGCVVAFAGIDPSEDSSGKYRPKSNPTSKRGSPYLRKTLFQIISCYLKRSPLNEPVYQFLDKKRSEGKPYYVYMTAAANKFLRIYYARVKEVMQPSFPAA
jgi:transposase